MTAYYTRAGGRYMSLPPHSTPPLYPLTPETFVMYGEPWDTFAQMVTALEAESYVEITRNHE